MYFMFIFMFFFSLSDLLGELTSVAKRIAIIDNN